MNIKTILVVLFAILLASCNSINNSESHEEEEAPKFKYTAYSNDFEVFAEADPFVIGQTGNVLSHFSFLSNFTAVESGKITLVIDINGEETRQTLNSPTRKGIYSFDIAPKTKGKGEMRFEITNEQGNFIIIVPNITVYATAEDGKNAAGKIVIPKTNTTVFTKEQSWKIDFRTEFPKVEAFGDVIKTTALVESAQGDEMIVSAKIGGVVRLTSANLAEGKDVAQGQALFSISGSETIDNNFSVTFNQAENNYLVAKAEYDRALELSKDKIVSDKDLLAAKNRYENAKIVYDNLNRSFSAQGQSVSSPMTGFIKQIFVKNGSFVEAGQPVIIVSQNKSLILSADLPSKYSSTLAYAKTANIRTLNDSKTYTLEQLNGMFLSYGKSANSDNYLIPIKMQIDNIGDFITGSFVEVFIKTISNNNALTIPNTSLIEEYGNFYVYVQINPELFEKREVKTGATDGIRTEIISGVSKSDRIVSEGAIKIKLAQSTGSLDAHSGHVH